MRRRALAWATIALALALPLAAAPAAGAKTRHVHFAASVEGKQTVIWQQQLAPSDPCQPRSSSNGTQTISFQSPKPKRLTIFLFSHLLGHRLLAAGGGQVPADWLIDRQFSSHQTDPACPEPTALAAQSSPDCGRRGPYRFFVAFAYRDNRSLTLDARANPAFGPTYRTCDYAASHELDLVETTVRLRLKKLLHRRVIHLHFSRHLNESDPDQGASWTTVLTADVTLRRVR